MYRNIIKDCRVHDALPDAVVYPTRETFTRVRRDADESEAAHGKERNDKLKTDVAAAAHVFAECWTAAAGGRATLEPYCKKNKLTFDKFFLLFFSFHVIQPLAPSLRRNLMVLYSCSCKAYKDDAVCKHALYEGITRKEIRLPLLMRLFYIGRDAQPGRPTKTVEALLKQPGENPLPLPSDPDDPPQRAELEDKGDWWSDEEEEPRGDPELEMAPAGGEEDGWVKIDKL